MTLLLELPPELEGVLGTEATRLSLSLPDYVLHVLIGVSYHPAV